MFYAKWAIFQLYHDENKLHFDMVMIYDVRSLLDQHSELVIYSASSLKRKSAGGHVAPFGHIIQIPS